jgi:hypothetical protein
MERNNEESESVIYTYLRAFASIGRYIYNSIWSSNTQLVYPTTPTTLNDITIPNAPHRPVSHSRVEAGQGDSCSRNLTNVFDDAANNPV